MTNIYTHAIVARFIQNNDNVWSKYNKYKSFKNAEHALHDLNNNMYSKYWEFKIVPYFKGYYLKITAM